MMRAIVLIICLLFFKVYYSFSHNVGIGITGPHSSARLDISSTNKGVLIPNAGTTATNRKTTNTDQRFIEKIGDA